MSVWTQELRREPNRLIDRPEVKRLTGLSRSKLIQLEYEGRFPPSAWHSSQQRKDWLYAVLEWIEAREVDGDAGRAALRQVRAANAVGTEPPALPCPPEAPEDRAMRAWEDELDVLGAFAPVQELQALLDSAPGEGDMVSYVRGFLAGYKRAGDEPNSRAERTLVSHSPCENAEGRQQAIE